MSRVLLTVLAVLLSVFTASAQKEATIKSFMVTTDHIPSNDRKNDFNGVPCALVKVQVVDEIERVEGNLIGDIVNRGVEKWVYMCKGSRNMRIHLKNHLPIKVMFQNYKINGLESNRVYELVLETPDMSNTPIINHNNVKGNNLQIRVVPSHATLSIWGDNMGKKVYRPNTEGFLSIFLPYGRYSYQASASGYETLEGTVFVDDNQSIKHVSLTAITGTLTIECPTEKVDFYINDKLINKSAKSKSWTGQLPPGNYNVQVRRKGYVTQGKTITVSTRQNSEVLFGRLFTEVELKNKEKDDAKKAEKALAKEKADSIAKEKKQKREQQARKQAEQKKIRNEVLAKKYEEQNKKSMIFGIAAGYNMATAQFSDKSSMSKTESVSAFHLGMTAEFKLVDCFYLETALLFSARGYEYRGYDIREEGNPLYIDIPAQASFHIPLSRVTKLHLKGGPYIGLCVGGKVKDKYDNIYDEKFSSAYSGFDYGLQGGVGFEIAYHFYLGANYQLGLDKKYPNRNLMFSLGYRF